MKIYYLALANTVTAPGGRHNEYENSMTNAVSTVQRVESLVKGGVSRTKHCKYCKQDAASGLADRQSTLKGETIVEDLIGSEAC
jgi:hypothetical protein